jgi:lincosamide nucleotidyltransferase A/C/D/E
MDAQAVFQVLDALEAAGIRPGITGGWGVDALLGRQTRDHRDLDIGVRDDQVPAAITVLESLGYAVTADERPARIALESGRGSVDIHPIAFNASGHGVQQGLNGQTFEYPLGSLEADGTIASRPVKVATPELHSRFTPGICRRRATSKTSARSSRSSVCIPRTATASPSASVANRFANGRVAIRQHQASSIRSPRRRSPHAPLRVPIL